MMKKLFFLFLVISFSESESQVMWQINKDTVVTWYYSEGDEFNEKSINKDYWNDWYGWARTIYNNKEQQYYSKWQNHEMRDGQLVLTVKKETVNERVVDWMGDNDSIIENKKFKGLNKRTFNYTAGLIQSKKDFLYGYYEIKFKTPKQNGLWPAFWLYGGNPNEEIDFMELKTEKKNQVHVDKHSQKGKDDYLKKFIQKKRWGGWVKFNGNLSEQYTVVGGEWTKDYIKYYINGELVGVTNLSMNCPKKLVANVAVPANNGPFKPGPAKNFSGTGEFEIDYIRVWTKDKKAETAARPIPVTTEISSTTKRDVTPSIVKPRHKFKSETKSKLEENINVTFVQNNNAQFELLVLGKKIPLDAKYTVYNNGKELLTNKIIYGSNTFNLSSFSFSDYKITVDIFGKKADYSFTKKG